MKKEELRLVKYTRGYYSTSVRIEATPIDKNKNNTKFTEEGFFHLWEKKMDEYGSEHICALIETKEGEMIYVGAVNIIFTDR